jgi:flagellar hook assembly protein FlgD
MGYYSFSNYKLAPRDSMDIGTVTGIEDDNLTIPSNFTLDQNYPNPFNPTTEIEYSVAASGNFSVNIYNILGQKVRTLVNEFHSIGNYKTQWNGLDDSGQQVGSGIYFYSLNGKNVNLTKKMILLK